MDEISVLRDVWGQVETSAPDARVRARMALKAKIDRASTRRTRSWIAPLGIAAAGTVAAGVAAAVAAGVIVAVAPAHGPDSGVTVPVDPPVAIGPVSPLELAAAYAAAQPFPQPRPDQWAYVELHIVVGGSPTTIRRSWYRIDGTQIAIPGPDGQIEITTHPEQQSRVAPLPTLNAHDYPTLAAMPREPQAMLTFLEAGLDPVVPSGRDRFPELFGLIGYILRENILPPDVTAALLRAAALIPGVAEVPGPVAVDGRTVMAVGLVEGWTREEILLDPATKEFLGSRSVAIADSPAFIQAPGDPTRVYPEPPAHAGDILYVITRGSCLIVDAPGQAG